MREVTIEVKVYARYLRLLSRERSLALTRGLGFLGLCSVLSAFEQGEIACCDTGPRLFGSVLGTKGFCVGRDRLL